MHKNYDMAGDSYLHGPEILLHYVTINLNFFITVFTELLVLGRRKICFCLRIRKLCLLRGVFSKPGSWQPCGNITQDSKK